MKAPRLSSSVALIAVTSAAGAAPAPPAFVRTQDSDAWVRATFRLQERYARVLLVRGRGEAPQRVSVAALELNTGRPTGAREYRVDSVFDTLQAAADAARGGDLVAVMPGSHAGFVLADREDAGDGRYVHFKALGGPGQVVIDRPPEREPDWMILLRAAHHVVIEGFNIAGATGPGLEPKGPLAGIMIDGDFGRSGTNAHHVAVVGNFSHNHRKWGLHSTDTHTVLIQDNLFALSCLEHSAYVSDGSDNYVIRRNVFYGSRSAGLQCNIDPQSSLAELLKHPALAPHRPHRPTREWAMALLEHAREAFGEHNFPDGRGVNFIIEDNVINGNGRGGGGALNLAGLQESLIQNNLIYGNFNHGIALWDNGNPYDAPRVIPGPRDPREVTGPDALPFWGCRSNGVRNNTVLMANPRRAALILVNGSWGNRVRNNVLINDEPSSLEVSGSSIYGLDSSHNVLNEAHYVGVSIHSVLEEWPYHGATEMAPALASLAVHLDDEPRSALGVTRARSAPDFVRYGEEAWVLIEGDWWRVNPKRPDFRPRIDSKLLHGRGDPTDMPVRDLAGEPRKGADIGALGAASR
ncbi:MAG TPA: right-handed parallel beta-helix repeat-containing protein [Vicinamibacteria bacterium]|nr:right-handed parallel beta-helix repeat-containing protein [Vicinamibacteria bacterium]